MLAFTKTKAQEGDQEAQVIYEQMELSQEVENLLENYNDNDLPESSGEDQHGIENASMRDANEEPQRTDPTPGEPDAAEGDPNDRKRIRAALEQGVDPQRSASGNHGAQGKSQDPAGKPGIRLIRAQPTMAGQQCAWPAPVPWKK
eukprot:6420196-Amphidinium_carterae.1